MGRSAEGEYDAAVALVVRASLTKRWASSSSNGRTNTGLAPYLDNLQGQAWTITSSTSTRHDYNANVP